MVQEAARQVALVVEAQMGALQKTATMPTARAAPPNGPQQQSLQLEHPQLPQHQQQSPVQFQHHLQYTMQPEQQQQHWNQQEALMQQPSSPHYGAYSSGEGQPQITSQGYGSGGGYPTAAAHQSPSPPVEPARGAMQGINASMLVQRLLLNGQPDVAMVVASAAGIQVPSSATAVAPAVGGMQSQVAAVYDRRLAPLQGYNDQHPPQGYEQRPQEGYQWAHQQYQERLYELSQQQQQQQLYADTTLSAPSQANGYRYQNY